MEKLAIYSTILKNWPDIAFKLSQKTGKTWRHPSGAMAGWLHSYCKIWIRHFLPFCLVVISKQSGYQSENKAFHNSILHLVRAATSWVPVTIDNLEMDSQSGWMKMWAIFVFDDLGYVWRLFFVCTCQHVSLCLSKSLCSKCLSSCCLSTR